MSLLEMCEKLAQIGLEARKKGVLDNQESELVLVNGELVQKNPVLKILAKADEGLAIKLETELREFQKSSAKTE